jgi:hypothetical protein
MRRLAAAVIALLALCLGSGNARKLLGNDTAPVTLSSRGLPASECLQMLSGATQVPMLLGPDILARGGDQTPLFLDLRQANLAVAAEAVAQGLGTWWLMTLQERLRFSDSITVPLGPLTTLTRPSSIEDQENLLILLQQFLTPWLGQNTGLVTHPSRNRIIATLDDAGHQRLLMLLRVLESGRAQVPPSFAPLPGRSMLAAASWQQLFQRAQDEFSNENDNKIAPFSMVKARDLPLATPPPTPLIGHRGRAAHLLIFSGNPRPRQHPAQRLQLAQWPIHHLLGDNPAEHAGKIAVLTAKLRSAVPTWVWTEPGSGIRVWPTTLALIVQADPSAIHLINQQLHRWDRQNKPLLAD